ncbi:MAG: hypothetical protein WKF64_08485 [Ilumatobacteraceae bacterium]
MTTIPAESAPEEDAVPHAALTTALTTALIAESLEQRRGELLDVIGKYQAVRLDANERIREAHREQVDVERMLNAATPRKPKADA